MIKIFLKYKGLFFLFLILFSSLWIYSWAEKIRNFPDPRKNLTLLDRHGVAIAGSYNPQYGMRVWKELSFFSPSLVQATLNQEDRRFYDHLGIDPLALARAAWVNLKSRRLSQGGSTITQQLAKILLENWRGKQVPRTLKWKFAEFILTLDLELRLSKKEILERYLNDVYLGHRLYGVEAASQAYFGKSSQDLTEIESQTLVSHIRRPNQPREILQNLSLVSIAPHLSQMASLQRTPGKEDQEIIRTTLDEGMQKKAILALRHQMSRFRKIDPKLQGALVVIDVKSGELRALVGSENFEDESHAGQVNHALAKRQPGSTLKPFTYFLAFLHHRHPANLTIDAPYHFYLGEEKSYTPQNFDRRYHGVLSLREALANSFNIPAVLTLEEVGTAYYLDWLHRFGFSSLTEGPSYYGLALTLGSGAVNLLELTNAYAALARGGEYQRVKWLEDRPPAVVEANPNIHPLLDSCAPCSPEAHSLKEKEPSGPFPTCTCQREQQDPFIAQSAFMVTSILSDPEARRKAFGDAALMNLDRQPVAVKTGTSHDSRDVWAVGYTPRYTVGVWIGHTDNSPMPGFTGAEVAIPLWNQVMQSLHEGLTPIPFQPPRGIKQVAYCRDAPCDIVKTDWNRQEPGLASRVELPEESFRFISPVNGDHFLIDKTESTTRQKISCRVRLPQKLLDHALENGLSISWKINGTEISSSSLPESKTFLTLSPGKYVLVAQVGEAKTKPVKITVSEMRE